MLVKEGHKGSYLLWGIVQIVLSVILIALTIPFMLSSVGIDTGAWFELVNKINLWVGGKYIIGAIHAIIVILFVATVLSIFFRRSGASLFVKLSAVAAMFVFACNALKNLVSIMFGKNIDIMSMFSGGMEYLLLAVSVVLLILGFVFQFTVSRNSEKKANLFLFSKAIIWIALLALNFVVPSILNASPWLAGIFGYTTNLPYFLCWYFLIMGIFQLISSPQLINPQDSKFSTGTQVPVMPVGYIPVQPVMVDPFTPVMPGNPALYGQKQGLENEENQTEQAPVDSNGTVQGLAETENAQETYISAPENAEVQPVEAPEEFAENATQPEQNFKQEETTTEPQEEQIVEPNIYENGIEENVSFASTSVDGDNVSQGLTPPEGYVETETLEQIRERNGEAPETRHADNEELGRELGEEKASQKEKSEETEESDAGKPVYIKDLEEKLDAVENVEEVEETTDEEATLEEAATAAAIATTAVASTKKPATRKTTTKKAAKKPAAKKAPAKKAKKVEVKEEKPAKVPAKKPAAKKTTTKKAAVKKEPVKATKTTAKKENPKEEPKAQKELSQNEKLKEIDKIIKTLSSPRQTSRTRKIRKESDDEE